MNHFVILAGGSGQRLWPLSTKKCPKHLIPFLDNKSLLEQTIERISDNQGNKKIWILTNQEQLNLVKIHLEHLHTKLPDIEVIAEPMARNTAPAILWMCNQINNIDNNATIVILPADHFIPEKEKFNETIETAINFAGNNTKIVTLGIIPTSPATGYGYIQTNLKQFPNPGTARGERVEPSPLGRRAFPESIHPVTKFHEKPTLEKAQNYIKQDNMFWNAGIFVAKVSTFLNEFETTSPKLFEAMQNFMCGKIDYTDLESISIDYAVMEKSPNISLIPANFQWHDVGNLSVFLSLKQRFGDTAESVINIDGFNNLASTNKKIVVCVGVSDLCIIETPDAILIAKNNCTESVKLVFPELKKIDANVL